MKVIVVLILVVLLLTACADRQVDGVDVYEETFDAKCDLHHGVGIWKTPDGHDSVGVRMTDEEFAKYCIE